MKKILVLSLLVLFTFGLAACDLTGEDIDDDDIDDIVCDDDETLVDGECVPDEDDTPADTTAPTIEGVEDVEIFVGADFDPMDDVTATDDTDGDVTEDVTYTGTFDVDSAGTYFIKYSVEDEAGNVREETRYITVVIDPSSVGDEMVPNGDFSLGWAIWNTTTGNEGGQATYSVEDEELVIEITSVSGGMWEPRLQNSGITFEEGKIYEVSFDARALAPRAIHVQVGEILDGAPYFSDFHPSKLEIFDLTTTMDTYTFTFAMTEETNENGSLLFEMGTVEGTVGTDNLLTTVYLDNVTIEEVDPDDFEDTEGPAINGIDDTTIEIDESFDALEGVTVIDNVDGELDITEDHVTGSVDSSTAGEYTLTYTISDEAGNETEETRTITVVEEIVLPDPEWTGYGMEIEETESEVTIDYTSIPDPWYNVNAQLSNIPFDGVHDTVEFTFTGEDGQDYLFKIEGGGVNTELAITADGTEQTLELDLTGMTEAERDGLNLIIVFAQTIGESGSLVIHDIEYKTTDDDTPAPDPEWTGYGMEVVETETEVTIDYTDVPTNWWEINAQLSNIPFDGVHNIVEFTFTGEDGQVYLFKIEGGGVATELEIAADGTEQTLELDLSSMTETERDGLNLITTFAKTVGESGSLVIHDIEYKTTEDDTPDQLATPFGVVINGSTLEWGAIPEASSFLVYVDGVTDSPFTVDAETYSYDLSTLDLDDGTYSVQVQAIGDDTTYVDSELTETFTYQVGPDYTYGWRSYINTWEGSAGSLEVNDSNELVLELSAINTWENYQIQIIQDAFALGTGPDNDGSLGFEADQSYRVTFDAASSVAGDITLAIGHSVDGWTEYHAETITVTDTMETYTVEFTLDDTEVDYTTLAQFKLEMGSLFSGETAPQTFTLDNVLIEELDDDTYVDANLIINGNFDQEDPAANQLSAPVGVVINEDTLAWGALPEADGFEVHIDGVTESPFVINAEVYSFDLSTLSLDAGTYDIQVQAIGDDVTTTDSEMSETVTYTVE